MASRARGHVSKFVCWKENFAGDHLVFGDQRFNADTRIEIQTQFLKSIQEHLLEYLYELRVSPSLIKLYQLWE